MNLAELDRVIGKTSGKKAMNYVTFMMDDNAKNNTWKL